MKLDHRPAPEVLPFAVLFVIELNRPFSVPQILLIKATQPSQHVCLILGSFTPFQ